MTSTHQALTFWDDKLNQLKETFYETLVEKTPDGFRPRPGVTEQHVLQVHRILDKVIAFRAQAVKDLSELAEENERHREEVETTRGLMRKIEKLSGVSTHPMLRKMYRL